MEEYRELWEKNVTARTSDFIVDEDGKTVVEDNSNVVIGGMITSKKVKTTKTNQLMAFITVEDLVGTVEVLVFPKIYERNRQAFTCLLYTSSSKIAELAARAKALGMDSMAITDHGVICLLYTSRCV